MKKNSTFLIILFSLFIYKNSFAQCEVTATALPSDIVCGDCVTLTAFGQGQGQSVFVENFDGGAPTGWQSTAQATYTNPCSSNGVDGTTHLWMGDATGVPRQMTTTGFDFSTATAGATICFDMLFAEQGDASPCEGPDEPDEGVAVEYSIDGGNTWIEIHYFDPNGGNDGSLVNWNNWCFNLPAAALTANTQIRWFQDNDSGAEYDHWGLDNVNVYFNDPTYEITWTHDNYSYGQGSAGGDNPTPVCPQTTTTYTVTMTNGTSTCTDQITIGVTPPTFRVDAGIDTTACAGDCVTLNANATVIKNPAKTPTYSNAEISLLTGFPSDPSVLLPCFNPLGGCQCPDGSTVNFGESCTSIYEGRLEMNINVTGLNSTSLQSGELSSVCIGDAYMGSGDFLPFRVELTCPQGNTIVLANTGDIGGATLLDACFDINSTNPISTGTNPYSGSWQPVDPLSNLNGCDPNGVWTLSMIGTFDLSNFGTFPFGGLEGWSITFDDPEISYEGNIVWSPTTDMTGETTSSPTICPTTSPVTYTMTVSDTAGCTSVSDDIVISLDNVCCDFQMSAAVTQPTCGATDGAIDMTVTGGSGNFTYNWTSGQGATADLTNLGSGTYTLTITDVTQNCQKDTTITLSAPNSPTITNIAEVDATCGNLNGSITITASGGTGSLTYSIDGGTTFQASNSFTGLAGSTYNIVVQDASGCDAVTTATVDDAAGATITNVAAVDASCGNSNGSITITATGGTGVLEYSIDGGTTFQASNSFTGLAANSYNIVIKDANDCEDTETSTVANLVAPTIDDLVEVDASCGTADGTITITASGGTGTLEYSIDGGATFQASNLFTGLAANTFNVVVKDANGCEVTGTATVANANAPIIDNIVEGDATCGVSDGSITITASGGTGALQYSIDGGTTFQAGNSFTGLAPNTYNVTVKDANDCVVNGTATVINANAPIIDNLVEVATTCGASDGSITITASGGTGALQYSIDGGTTYQVSNSFASLLANTYNVVVKDASGCEVTATANIIDNAGPSILNASVVDASCGNSDGSITINISGGTAPFQYSIDGGTTFQNSNVFSNLASGNYNLVVEDDNSCAANDIANINNSNGPSLASFTIVDESCLGENDGTISVNMIDGLAPYSFNWSNGDTSNINLALAGDNYSLTVTDANGCTYDTTFTVNEGVEVNLSLNNDTSINQGETIVLNSIVTGSTNGTYNWTPNTDLSCADCAAPVASPIDDVTYVVNYTDTPSLCTASASISVTVIKELPFCIFPSAFSPNGDVVNEGFGGICDNVAYFELKVYNRWGELVFKGQDNDGSLRWDGTYKGKPSPLDVFIYSAVIEYTNGETENTSGTVTIIR